MSIYMGKSINAKEVKQVLNPFMLNGFSHHYQLDESISNLKGCKLVSFNSIQTLKVDL